MSPGFSAMKRAIIMLVAGVAGMFLSAWIGRLGQANGKYYVEIFGAILAFISFMICIVSIVVFAKKLILYFIKN